MKSIDDLIQRLEGERETIKAKVDAGLSQSDIDEARERLAEIQRDLDDLTEAQTMPGCCDL